MSHVAVAIDSWGIRLGDHPFVADSGGYEALVTWAETHGRIEAFGIEGTGSYGAGLARAVHRAGHHVVEVNRGDRRTRRAAGKSDTIDAEVAARSLLAGQSTAIPKTADGAVEMIRQLKITRDTAMKARTAAMNTLKQIIMQAPPVLREALHDLTDHGLLTRCAGLRPGPIDTPIAAAKHTLRSLARRWMALAEEIALHDQHLARLTTATAPTLCEGFGVGAHTAAELLIIFGDNLGSVLSSDNVACVGPPRPSQNARTITSSPSTPRNCRTSQLTLAPADFLSPGAVSFMEQEIVRRCKLAVTSRSLAAFGTLKAQRNSCDAINESHTSLSRSAGSLWCFRERRIPTRAPIRRLNIKHTSRSS